MYSSLSRTVLHAKHEKKYSVKNIFFRRSNPESTSVEDPIPAITGLEAVTGLTQGYHRARQTIIVSCL